MRTDGTLRVAPVCAALWFSIGALLSCRGTWLALGWACAATHLTVGNPRWPARIAERHWPGIFSLLYYQWLALVSSSKNAEVTQSTESPLCQLILPVCSSWVSNSIYYLQLSNKWTVWRFWQIFALPLLVGLWVAVSRLPDSRVLHASIPWCYYPGS